MVYQDYIGYTRYLPREFPVLQQIDTEVLYHETVATDRRHLVGGVVCECLRCIFDFCGEAEPTSTEVTCCFEAVEAQPCRSNQICKFHRLVIQWPVVWWSNPAVGRLGFCLQHPTTFTDMPIRLQVLHAKRDCHSTRDADWGGATMDVNRGKFWFNSRLCRFRCMLFSDKPIFVAPSRRRCPSTIFHVYSRAISAGYSQFDVLGNLFALLAQVVYSIFCYTVAPVEVVTLDTPVTELTLVISDTSQNLRSPVYQVASTMSIVASHHAVLAQKQNVCKSIIVQPCKYHSKRLDSLNTSHFAVPEITWPSGIMWRNWLPPCASDNS